MAAINLVSSVPALVILGLASRVIAVIIGEKSFVVYFAMPTPLVLLIDRRPTPIGEMSVVTDEQEKLRGIGWSDLPERLMEPLTKLYRTTGHRFVDARCPLSIADPLDAYFAGDLIAIDAIKVETGGTPFQREVWTALRRVSCGSTMTYGAMAKALGRPDASRAVGAANGFNPISVVVPCHRLIGANGSLVKYGGGMRRKEWLLAHEGGRATLPLPPA